MASASEARSGKTHRDENFPVASWLIKERYRAPILAFYRFARAADDVADHPNLPPDEKLALLDRLGEALSGSRSDPEAEPLRRALGERGLVSRHAFDLLEAFRMDVRKHRYDNWAQLMEYCRLSAMPVGRFVLDVHGENAATWPASDALCAALQIINHLQDCGMDYRRLDRVYLPQDLLAANDASSEMLGLGRAPPALLKTIADLARRAHDLIDDGASLVPRIANLRLALEIAAIEKLARHLVRKLEKRDPLSEPVHLDRVGFALIGGLGALRGLVSVFTRSVGRRPKVRV
ncbi:MAG: squalene synthase HpnC [Hyphomicrobiales bacterium]|nr:squalene synthase HpnC [Hyphomicrobiales bacterium]